MDGTLSPDGAPILTRQIYHPVRNELVHGEVYSLQGHPWQPLPATDPAGVTAAGLYPLDGDGVIDAATGTTITLDATGIPTTVDLSGWCVCITSGTGIGQVRQLKAYDTSLRRATVDTWDTTPSAGDAYVVGYDVFGRAQAVVSAEFEAATDTALVHCVFFGFPWNPPATGTYAGRLGIGQNNATGRAPRRGLGRALEFEAVNYQVGVQQSGFYHGANMLSEDCRGATLVKLWLRTPPGSSHKVALQLGAT